MDLIFVKTQKAARETQKAARETQKKGKENTENDLLFE